MHVSTHIPRLLSFLVVLPLAVAAPAVAGLSAEAGEARRRKCMASHGSCAPNAGALNCAYFEKFFPKFPLPGQDGGWVCALY
jgi:hypothetical protein